MIARTIAAVLLAGWLADRLARHDPDVEAGIDAYEAGQHDDAIAAFDRAVARLGERPEIAFDRGLALLAKGDTEAAKTAFEHASEAERLDVRASAFYQLGNLALGAEAYDDAIARYIDCLQARPDHENAKWNLEIALQRKRKDEEKKDEEKQDEKDQENDGSEDSGGSDDSGGSEDSGGTGGSGETGGSEDSGGGDSGGSGDSGGGDSGQPQDDQKQDDQKQDDQKQDDQKQDDQKQDDQKQDDQKQADQKQDAKPQEQPAAPTPVERADLQRALDQLDEQDGYLLDRPRGRTNGPIKDW